MKYEIDNKSLEIVLSALGEMKLKISLPIYQDLVRQKIEADKKEKADKKECENGTGD